MPARQWRNGEEDQTIQRQNPLFGCRCITAGRRPSPGAQKAPRRETVGWEGRWPRALRPSAADISTAPRGSLVSRRLANLDAARIRRWLDGESRSAGRAGTTEQGTAPQSTPPSRLRSRSPDRAQLNGGWCVQSVEVLNNSFNSFGDHGDRKLVDRWRDDQVARRVNTVLGARHHAGDSNLLAARLRPSPGFVMIKAETGRFANRSGSLMHDQYRGRRVSNDGSGNAAE